MKKRKVLMLLCLATPIFYGSLVAQDSLKLSMRNEALRDFDEKNYVGALPLFEELLRSQPMDPGYQYYTGVCLVMLNSNLEESIQLLRSASNANYNPLAWYYLGRALHLQYYFDDAIKAYSNLILNGKTTEIKSLDVERQIEMCRNGIEFTRAGKPLQVQSSRTVPAEQLQSVGEINGSGKLLKKPVEFSSKTDLNAGFQSWMFMPFYTEINDFIYVTGYEKGQKNQKQIFRIKNMNNEIWGIPEILDEPVNTPYDEEFPYFDVKTAVLYFSSKGHSSMGGYDIFKSVYDWNSKTWTKPENLGFPINTPYDDFAFITDGFSTSASFASTRNSGPNRVIIYKIKLRPDTTGIPFENMDEIRIASQLLVESLPSQDKSPIKDTIALQDNKDVNNYETFIQTDKPGNTKVDYDKLLAEALILQVKADSLTRIARNKRILAREAPDEELKKELINEIISIEKEAKSYQRDADTKFTRAREIKGEANTEPGRTDSVITQTGEINGIKIYEYKPDPSLSKEEETNNIPAKVTPAVVPVEETPPVKQDEFSTLEKLAYNDSNPIPQGLKVYPGLVYRIQLGVFSRIKPPDAFGGINPVCYEFIADRSIFKYYAGVFHSLNSVSEALLKVRAIGYPDAFIVAYSDGQTITTEKAKEIEYAGFKF
jgi:hypothetical protein